MSKVKTYYGNKSKAIRRNRRVETKLKKKQRMNTAYSYFGGYYTVDTKTVKHYEIVDVPEKTESRVTWNPVTIPWPNEDGSVSYRTTYRQEVIEKTIPAHKERRYVSSEDVDIKPRLYRFDDSSYVKWFKKQASRRFRRLTNELYNGSSYKKVYDLAWMAY